MATEAARAERRGFPRPSAGTVAEPLAWLELCIRASSLPNLRGRSFRDAERTTRAGDEVEFVAAVTLRAPPGARRAQRGSRLLRHAPHGEGAALRRRGRTRDAVRARLQDAARALVARHGAQATRRPRPRRPRRAGGSRLTARRK